MKFTYIGHSAFLLKTATHTLAFDPFLTGNPANPGFKPEEIKADYVLITHGHNDHIGDALAIAKHNGATIISNHEIATFFEARGAKAHGMNTGGSFSFPFGRVKQTIAFHGSTYEENGQLITLGCANGFVISAEGKNVYFAGDTCAFSDMKLIGEFHPLDVAILPIGDNYTMGIDEAVRAVEYLNPKLVIPVHYGTFGLIDVNPGTFAEKLAAKGFRCAIVKPGDALNL